MCWAVDPQNLILLGSLPWTGALSGFNSVPVLCPHFRCIPWTMTLVHWAHHSRAGQLHECTHQHSSREMENGKVICILIILEKDYNRTSKILIPLDLVFHFWSLSCKFFTCTHEERHSSIFNAVIFIKVKTRDHQNTTHRNWLNLWDANETDHDTEPLR